MTMVDCGERPSALATTGLSRRLAPVDRQAGSAEMRDNTGREKQIATCYYVILFAPTNSEEWLPADARPSSSSRMPVRWLLLFVGFTLLGLLIYRIGPADMLAAWRQAHKANIAIAATVFIFSLLMRGIKWRLFLAATPTPLSYLQATRAYVYNSFFANLTPGRSGEVFVPVWLGRHGVSTATSYAIVVIDRMLDVLVVLSLFALSVINLGRLAPAESAVYRTAGLTAGLLASAGLIVLLVALIRLDLAIAFLTRFHGRLATRLRGALTSFRDAVARFGRCGLLAANLGITLTTWLLDVTCNYLVVGSIIPELTWTASVTASLFAIAAALASFIPGGIGAGALGYTAVLAIIGYDPVLAGAGAVLNTLLVQVTRTSVVGAFALRAGKKD